LNKWGVGMSKGTIEILVVLLLIASQLREREVKVTRLWIVPVLLFYVMIETILNTGPLTFVQVLGMLMTFCIGCGIGWVRGKLMNFRINPHTGVVLSSGSIVGLLFWLGILALKLGIRTLENGTPAHGSVNIITDLFLTMGLGSIVTRRLFIYQKYKQLKSQHMF
jgi:membrane protein CcdC involved in cytochrome C biogenesis